ncbi:MAG: hypothetical protein RML37_12385, partial [Chitinophagales bacterium]|nr:hypothetical protein [Chitinophagales bacterium]
DDNGCTALYRPQLYDPINPGPAEIKPITCDSNQLRMGLFDGPPNGFNAIHFTPGENYDGHVIEFSKHPMFTPVLDTAVVMGDSVLLLKDVDSLEWGEFYFVRVRSFNSSGFGPYSASCGISITPTLYWVSVDDDNWHSPANWRYDLNLIDGHVPDGCAFDVQILNGTSPVKVNTPVQVGSISIPAGQQIVLNSNLTVCNEIKPSATLPPSRITGNGRLVLNGNHPYDIVGKLDVDRLMIDNGTASVTIMPFAELDVYEALELKSGTLNASMGNVRLKSAEDNKCAYLGNFSAGYTGNYVGKLTVERYIGNTADGYRDISAPVNANVSELADDMTIFGQNNVNCWYAYNPYPNVQIYDEAANNGLSTPSGNYYTGWISRTGLTNPMPPMQGFAIRTYHGAPFVIDLTGIPRNGLQSINITHTGSDTPDQDGWNFVGNPYPSPIDWSDVLALNPGIEASYYAFNTTGEYSGNWSSHNGVTGVNGGTRNIASMQGFFIRKAAPGSQLFMMDNSVREAESGTVFHKGASLADEIRLELTGNGNSDEIVTYTEPTATAGFDIALDAVKMPAGSTVYMSYKHNGKEYAINVIEEINETTELPLVLWARDTGLYTLHATSLNLPGYAAWFKDAQDQLLIPLTASGAGIQIPLNGGEVYEGRYSIVFKKEEVVEPVHLPEGKNDATYIRIYSYQNKVVVERTTELPAQISISNVLGQEVKFIQTFEKRTEIALEAGAEWYAIVKVKQAGGVKTAKVL